MTDSYDSRTMMLSLSIVTLMILAAFATFSAPSEASVLETQNPLMMNDCLIAPDLEETASSSQSSSSSPEPGFYDTSEYMIGSMAVEIILLESDGSGDPSTEDWTNTEKNNVQNEITAGINWWATHSSGPGLSVSIVGPTTVTTQYEPISRPHTDEGLWIGEAMGKLGASGATYFDQVRNYVNTLRSNQGTDWAWLAFVVDSSNDGDGMFSDSWFGYAYLGGPFIVMTYDNNGWGIGNMDCVTAHEMGHIFYATDEYDGVTEYSGYLNAADIESSGCIMDTNSWSISAGTLKQIGWQDSDLDGVLDILDTPASTSLIPLSPDPTNSTSITYSGTAIVTPLSNSNPNGPGNDVTIAIVKSVDYSVDGSSWTAATPSDGIFDQTTEAFTFSFTTVQGDHAVYVMSISDQGNPSTGYSSDVFSVDTTAPTSEVASLGSYSNTQIVTVHSNVYDNYQVTSLELWYSKDGGSYSLYSTILSPPWEYQFDVGLTGGDGNYRFYSIATDTAGNREAIPAGYDAATSFDLTAPSSSASVVIDPSDASKLNVSATVSENFSVDELELWYSYQGGVYHLYGTLASSPWEWTMDTTTFGGDGLYSFYTRAVDDAGNYEDPPTSPDTSVTVDSSPPVSTFSISKKAINSSLEINMSVEDMSSIASLTLSYRFEGGEWTVFETMEESPWEFTFDFPDGEGEYYLNSIAVDAQGSEELFNESSTVNVEYDVSVPSTLSLGIEGGVHSNSSSVRASWWVADDGSGINSVSLRIDDLAWENVEAHSHKDIIGLEEGEHTLTLKSTDLAGNEIVETFYFHVDLTTPSLLSFTLPDDISSSEFSFGWNFTDDGSGIDHYEISIDGGSFQDIGNKTTITLYLSGGSHTVSVMAVDGAGNYLVEEANFNVETGDSTGILLPALAIIAVGAVAAAAFLVLRQRSSGR